MTIDPTILERLSQRQRRVLELRLAGHSWRTIGRALGIHEATARGHYNAALDAIATATAQGTR